MATAPVEVKRTAPTAPAARAPELLRGFRSDMDRLFDRFAGSFGLPSFARMFDAMPGFDSGIAIGVPAVDITENGSAFKLTAELPGMAEKDVEVTLTGDTLVLKGEKRQESEKSDTNYHLSERSWGSFQRSFALPQDVDRDNISAEFAKGVLTVTLPKTEHAQKQHKQIEVKSAS
jgi:HSP20 family protein